MQQTLQTSIQMKGHGRHCGKMVHMRLHPAPENSGVVFRFAGQEVGAGLDCADDEQGLVLKQGGETLYAVAPLLAAFYGMGIDNVLVELDRAEVPGMDGSATPFVFLVQSAGIKPQQMARQEFQLSAPLQVKRAGAWARVLPSERLRIASLNQAGASRDTVMEISKAAFVSTLCHAGARRFEHIGDTHHLRSELIHNKQILECLADISLLNGRLRGTYIGYRADHALSLRLLKQLEAENVRVQQEKEISSDARLLVNAR